MGKPMSTVYVPDEYGRLVPTQMPTQIGFIGLYAGPEPPEGYLYCDGSAIGRETYSELYDAIGTLYGAGDGAETFNLPDARGVFFRGDGGENNAAMGVQQGDAIRDIVGAFVVRPWTGGGNIPSDTVLAASGALYEDGTVEPGTPTGIQANTTITGSQKVDFHASRVVPTAAENRPINMAFKPCIRYV